MSSAVITSQKKYGSVFQDPTVKIHSSMESKTPIPLMETGAVKQIDVFETPTIYTEVGHSSKEVRHISSSNVPNFGQRVVFDFPNSHIGEVWLTFDLSAVTGGTANEWVERLGTNLLENVRITSNSNDIQFYQYAPAFVHCFSSKLSSHQQRDVLTACGEQLDPAVGQQVVVPIFSFWSKWPRGMDDTKSDQPVNFSAVKAKIQLQVELRPIADLTTDGTGVATINSANMYYYAYDVSGDLQEKYGSMQSKQGLLYKSVDWVSVNKFQAQPRNTILNLDISNINASVRQLSINYTTAANVALNRHTHTDSDLINSIQLQLDGNTFEQMNNSFANNLLYINTIGNQWGSDTTVGNDRQLTFCKNTLSNYYTGGVELRDFNTTKLQIQHEGADDGDIEVIAIVNANYHITPNDIIREY